MTTGPRPSRQRHQLRLRLSGHLDRFGAPWERDHRPQALSRHSRRQPRAGPGPAPWARHRSQWDPNDHLRRHRPWRLPLVRGAVRQRRAADRVLAERQHRAGRGHRSGRSAPEPPPTAGLIAGASYRSDHGWIQHTWVVAWYWLPVIAGRTDHPYERSEAGRHARGDQMLNPWFGRVRFDATPAEGGRRCRSWLLHVCYTSNKNTPRSPKESKGVFLQVRRPFDRSCA